MYPLAYSYNISDTYQDVSGKEMFGNIETWKSGETVQPLITEPEIVYFPDINALCVQGNPELDSCPEETRQYIKFLCEKLVENKLVDYIYEIFNN